MGRAQAGQGYEYQLPSGVWCIAGSYRGERYSVTGATKAAVRVARDQRKAAIASGQQSAAARRSTLAGLVAAWLATKRPPATSYATYARYVLAGRQLVDAEYAGMGDWTLQELADVPRVRRALRRLSDAAGLSPRSVRYCHLALQQTLAVAAEDGLRVAPLPRSVKPPRQTRAPAHVPDAADVRALLAAASLADGWRALWTLAAYTGLRLGELLAVRWSDLALAGPKPAVTVRQSVVDGEQGPQIRPVPKTGVRGVRTVPLAGAAVAALAEWRDARPGAKSGLVFPARDGSSPRPKWEAEKRFDDALTAAGLTRAHLRPHLLRHAAASHWLARGLTVPQVSALLGHASAAVTLSVYAHVLGHDYGPAAAILTDVYGPETEAGMSGRGRTQQGQNGVSEGPLTDAVTDELPGEAKTA